MSDHIDISRCPKCGDLVDEDGTALSECPGGSGEKCDECFACVCDGSC